MVEKNTKIKKQDQKNVVQVTWSSKRPKRPLLVEMICTFWWKRNSQYFYVHLHLFLCDLTGVS